MAKAVVSTIGSDRPGLIADITSRAQDAGLNIEDSRMTVLGGEFAMLMAVAGTPEALEHFESALKEISTDNLAYLFRNTTTTAPEGEMRPYLAQVVALDHPGIVAAIARFFSARQINIRNLDTSTTPAPHTGTPIFNVTLTADVPADIRIRELKEAFLAFCDDLDLDGSLDSAL